MPAFLVILAACAGGMPETLSSDPTPEAYAAAAGLRATLIPAGQYVLDDRRVDCKSLPTVLNPHLDDYAAASPKFIAVRPDMMAKPPTAVKLWIYYHECGHESIGPDESRADCFAVNHGVRDGWLSKGGLDEVCAFISVAQPDAAHAARPERCQAMRACYASATRGKKQQR